jgi:YVTN family beta-propeller protein
MKQTAATCLTILLAASHALAAQPALPIQHRRPAALALLDEGRSLCVANRRSGTVSLVDIDQRTVSEKQIGQQLSDVVLLPDSNELLVSDFAGGSVIVLTHSAGRVDVTDRIDVAKWPVSIAVNRTGSFSCVASLWSRRLTILQRSESKNADAKHIRSMHEIDLPFAPRAAQFVDASHVVVADSFGGRLVVVDCDGGRITVSHELPVHNIRDMTLGVDGRLYVTCQQLDPTAYTSSEDIHWGILMENKVLAISIESLMKSDDTRPLSVEGIALGGPGDGAGDPENVLVTASQLLVTLAGTDELAIVDRVGVRETRISTGSRPVGMVLDEDSNRAFVVNALSDSVSVIDLAVGGQVASISLGPSPAAGLVERGERAFFNAKLSFENWMSCQSCHTDGHTNNGLADTLGDGGFGDAKRVPTLRGVWSTGPWAWNGSEHLLHSQIRQSLTSTMHHRAKDDDLFTDLTAYVSQLERVPSLLDARDQSPHPSIGYQAREVFESVGCSKCHNGFTSYTTDGTFDVGLQDLHGNSRFNPPSLSGVSQRDRLFHDGRARSLEDVLVGFGHPSKDALSESQRTVLIEFLRAL